MLGVSFSVNEVWEDESSDSSTSSSYSTGSESGSIDFSDREVRIADLVEYLRSASSGYDSV